MVLLAGALLGQTQNEHVLGHPAVASSHGRGDAQRVALLPQQRVATVSGAVGPDLVGLRELSDVLLIVAGPGNVLLMLGQRRAHGVRTGDPGAALIDEVHGLGPHARHNAHIDDDVGRVGDLNTQLGDRTAERTHGEGNHVHRATGISAVELLIEDLLHLDRVAPVVGRARVLLLLRADEGAGLDAGDIARQRTSEEGVGSLLGVEAGEHARLDHLGGQTVPLLVGTVAEVDALRLAELGEADGERDDVLRSVGGRGSANILLRHSHMSPFLESLRLLLSGQSSLIGPDRSRPLRSQRGLLRHIPPVFPDTPASV